MKNLFVVAVICWLAFACQAKNHEKIVTGAGQPEKYLPLLKNKSVGVVVNHTSLKDGIHLVDFLLSEEINVSKIFAPEHSFRGDASAGEEIEDGIDSQTGIPVFSLYGQTRKPTDEHLDGLDIVIFDIQDVGCRFYTYISTMHLVMEACAEHNKPVLVLDRPNPNGHYVDGPVREPDFQSFVGMHPIPVVHGCTVGELAKMINGENWLDAPHKCELTVIPVKNYTHKTSYSLPVSPSPNLPNDLAIQLYPSLCFFEATSVSIGRGTDFPFQVIGGAKPSLGKFTFTPRSIPGVAVNPVNEGEKCYGVDLRQLEKVPDFTLKYFMDFYNKYENEEDFLTRERWFNLLAGTDELIAQIREGHSESDIKETWQPGLEKYKQLRKKYLLYPDFE
jgi:uncharacterized protein YbbC (DUF1343 family)